MPSGWNAVTLTASVDNGVTITGATGGYLYYTETTFSGSLMIDEMMKVVNQASGSGIGEGAVGLTTTSPSWISTFSMSRSLEGTNPIIGYVFSGSAGSTSTEFEPVGSFGVLSFSATPSGMDVYSNYQSIETSTDVVPSSYYIVGSNAGAGASVFIQWLRTRAYPPNGVMPTAVVGG